MTQSSVLVPAAFRSPQVVGLDHSTQNACDKLFAQWSQHLPRNVERELYLDAKNKLKDFRVAIPPQLVDALSVVMGWPEKAVYEMANRIVFERFLGADGDRDPFGLSRVLYENRFEVEFPQLVASSLAQSTAFLSTTPGDVASGEPRVLIMSHSAMWATGLWDNRRRAISAGLLIGEIDQLGSPIAFTLALPQEWVVCRKGGRGWYVDDVIRNRLGRPGLEHLPYRPTLNRPFGRARIDRVVMSLTDRAVRTGARLDVHAEMFSALKLILLGVGEDAFRDQAGNPIPMWSFYMGRANTLEKDEDGDLPQVMKIAAESPEPHIAVMRQLASEFSGHTGVPLSALGVASESPESADSKQMAREDNINDAEKQHVIYGATLKRVAENVVMIRDGLAEAPREVAEMTTRWRRADRPTLVSIADAGSKQVSMLSDEQKQTEVALELLGLEPDQISRMQQEVRRAASRAALDRVLGVKPTESGPTAAEVESGAGSG
ncbi:MAG: phage portal protein [Salana multivorans]|uniref:hypothetical protein n=1 Tax=Salana multivorans TaxID=120377 RepID=UPI000969F072|nr:hypothetical protein [Salana multivorans]MBN8883408.1 phage portal protein [Salana multivorans]OJX94077.1 MAG: hypothetical protein BGO96_09735 [Micrococcales bacterium 73-15]